MNFQKKKVGMCTSRKCPYPPRKGLEIPGECTWGFPKTKKFKEMYEFELEFREGRKDLIKNPFRGGMDILWNYTFIVYVLLCEWLTLPG